MDPTKYAVNAGARVNTPPDLPRSKSHDISVNILNAHFCLKKRREEKRRHDAALWKKNRDTPSSPWIAEHEEMKSVHYGKSRSSVSMFATASAEY
jgi:hypothetical protein